MLLRIVIDAKEALAKEFTAAVTIKSYRLHLKNTFVPIDTEPGLHGTMKSLVCRGNTAVAAEK